MNQRFLLLRLGAALLFPSSFLLLPSALPAASRAWDGPASGGLWGTGLNWSGDIVPTTGDDVTLSTSVPAAATVSISLGTFAYSAATSLGSLTINPTGTTTSFTLSLTNAAGAMHTGALTIGTTSTGAQYTQSAGSTTVTGTMTIGSAVGGSGTFTLSGSGTVSTVSSFIGAAGVGTFTHQGGTHDISGTMTIGNISNTASNYNMSGGALNLNGGADLVVGSNGRGNFSLSAGTLTATAGSQILITTGATAFNNTFTLSGTGSIAGTGTLVVGQGGTATFNQTGGTFNFGTSGDIQVGDAGGNGTVTISGGTLQANHFALGMANTGVGTVTQSGTAAVTLSGGGGGLAVGLANTGADSTYNLNGGTLTLTNVPLTIGSAGRGVFNQTAGTLSLTGASGTLTIASTLTAFTNAFNLSGTGQITNVDRISVGQAGIGNFTQGTGTSIVMSGSGDIFVSEMSTGVGTYNFNGGTISGGGFVVGSSAGGPGFGILNAAGGTATLTHLTVRAGGVVNISAGSLTLNNSILSVNGSGVFQTGGTVNINNTSGRLFLGDTAADGYYELTGGTIALAANTQLVVGRNVGASVFVQSGGNITTGGGSQTVTLGLNAGTQGSYFLSGTGSLTSASIVVGQDGGGTMEQSGASSQVTTGSLRLAVSSGTTGSYSMSGGTLTINNGPAALTVGESGQGTFTMSAGTLTFSNTNSSLSVGGVSGGALGNAVSFQGAGASLTGLNSFSVANGNNTGGVVTHSNGSVALRSGTGLLTVGTAPGANGQYLLSGPTATSTLSAPTASVGQSGTGNFQQSGGTATFSVLNLGVAASGAGTYSLTGGILNATNFNLGLQGAGTYTQPSGSGTANIGFLSVGAGSSPNANATVAAGTLNVTGSLTVGSSASATMHQTGGTVNVTSGFSLGLLNGVTGTYNLSGGSFLQPSGSASIAGNSGTGGLFNISGSGSANFSVPVNVGAGGTGTLTLASGSLTVPAVSNLGLIVGANGTFTMSGGSFSGDLTNGGVVTYSGGSFTGTFTNNATFNLNGFFNAGGSITNNATITVNQGGGLSSNGSSLANTGTLRLAGGLVGGSATLLNQGILEGYGTIFASGGLQNQGIVQQGAGTLALSTNGANINFASFQLAGGRIFQLGNSTLQNRGDLQLNGALVTGSGAGTIANQAGGVLSGPGNILAQVTNTGTIQPGSGTLNINPAFTNSGLIQLTGFTSNLTGGTLTNNGTLQGLGTVSNAIVNNNLVEAIGGTLALSGAVNFNAAGTFLAGAGGKILLTGTPGTNAGIVSLSGGTFDTNGQAFTNGSTGQISGFGSFRTGGAGLTNNGSITFTGGQTTVNGNVTNSAGQTLRVLYNPITFTGNVTNNGTFQVTQTTATFAGTFTNNGSFLTNSAFLAENVVFGRDSVVLGEAGHALVIGGDLTNLSTQRETFHFDLSQVRFTGGTHQMVWGSSDLGATEAGFERNFVIGTIALDSGASLTLQNTNARLPGALYVHTLELAGGLAQLSGLQTNGQNIYYDAGALGNAYLAGGTFDLPGGGQLIPTHGVPEPGTWALILIGGGVLAAFRKGRRRSRAKRDSRTLFSASGSGNEEGRRAR